jgi:hypothetical protein
MTGTQDAIQHRHNPSIPAVYGLARGACPVMRLGQLHQSRVEARVVSLISMAVAVGCRISRVMFNVFRKGSGNLLEIEIHDGVCDKCAEFLL